MIIKMNKSKNLQPFHCKDLPTALLRKFKTVCDKYNKQHPETIGEDKSCSSSSL